MPYKDREKQRQYQQEWHKEHRRPLAQQTSRQKRKQMVHDAKAKPCACCGKTYHYSAMDLHHLDPTKKDGMVGEFVKTGTYKTLQEEIDKCVVLCAICHRLLHAGQIELPGRVVE
jgi:hypothetical protein